MIMPSPRRAPHCPRYVVYRYYGGSVAFQQAPGGLHKASFARGKVIVRCVWHEGGTRAVLGYTESH